jgi:putative hydrolase of the HAD superfamily
VGLAKDFDELFFSCRLGVRKPDAELYRRVQQALDIKPEAILFVDDQQKNVDAAHSAGWRAERYTLGDDAAAIFARHGL